MKIKIFKDECLFDENGMHIIEHDRAVLAQEDTEVEVLQNTDLVLELLRIGRLNKGLDKDGNPIPKEETVENVVIEQQELENTEIQQEVTEETLNSNDSEVTNGV